MFLYKGDTWTHETMLHGVRYVTVSHYDGDKDVFEKLGDLIENSFRSSNVDELTNESLLVRDIAIPNA